MLYGSLFSLCMCMFLWECLRLSFSLQFSGFVFAACFRQFVSPTFRAHVGMHVGGRGRRFSSLLPWPMSRHSFSFRSPITSPYFPLFSSGL